ncbi:DUF4328 domain-containing protein [Amycolatopsis dongchuanensis]|uniref:DUF4328 domain-containing protein n=1 Tax=Amycolatopsis dongchuanensis TaxID=1070866 RepID=A0ABP8VMD6_9PSEU
MTDALAPFAASSPSESEPVRPLTALGAAAAVAVVLAAVARGAVTWTHWHAYHVVTGYLDGSAPLADVVAADSLNRTLRWVSFAVLACAGAAVAGWLWRARRNAESRSLAQHRLGRGWVIGGWICPVVNFWYPHTIVSDVWKTSRPGSPETLNLARVRGSGLVTAWWSLYLLSALVDLWATVGFLRPADAHDLFTASLTDTVAFGIRVVSGGLFLLVIARITAWQKAASAC